MRPGSAANEPASHVPRRVFALRERVRCPIEAGVKLRDQGRSVLPHSLAVAVCLYLATMVLFIVLDTIAKHLLAVHSIVFIAWVRFFLHFVVLAAILPAPRRERLRTRNLRLLAVRSMAWMSITFLFYAGLRHVPLAESIMLVSTAPFMIALLAGPALGERIRPTTWAAIVLGFTGVIVVLRPGFGALHWGAVFPLLAAAAFSVAQVVTKRLSAEEDHWTILIYSAGIAALLLTPFGISAWPEFAPTDWLWLAPMGLLAAAGDIAILAALRRAPASTLAPYQYSQILWAMIAGALVFGEFPDGIAITGATIIVAGGLVLWRAGVRAPQRPSG